MAKDDNSESQTKGENRKTEREEETGELFAFQNADWAHMPDCYISFLKRIFTLYLGTKKIISLGGP